MLQDYLMELELRGQSKNTIRCYGYTMSNFFQYIGKDAKSVTEADIKRYMIHLKNDRKASNKTIHRHLNALRSFYRYLGLNVADKVMLPKLSKPLPKFLTREEVKILLDIPKNQRDKCLIRTLYATGLRLSELVNLNRKDVKTDTIHVLSGKGSKDRIVFLDHKTGEMLRAFVAERKDEHEALFLSRKGKRLNQRSVQWLIKKYAKQSGIDKNITPHILRHSFATHMLEGDADIVVIKELLGHSNLSTTQIYTHVTDERRKKVYEKSHPLSKKDGKVIEEENAIGDE